MGHTLSPDVEARETAYWRDRTPEERLARVAALRLAAARLVAADIRRAQPGADAATIRRLVARRLHDVR